MKAAAIASLAGIIAAESSIEQLYAQYVAQYGKTYLTAEEYLMRQTLFAKNHYQITMHNMSDKTTQLAHNHMSDWTDAEYQALLGFKPELMPETTVAEELSSVQAPSSVDWRDSLVSARRVKNQGQCGSCWAFSTIGSIETRSEIKTKETTSLSEQQLVDCVYWCLGCHGGNYFLGFDYS